MQDNSEKELLNTYQLRDLSKGDRYSYFKPDVRVYEAEKEFVLASFLHGKVGKDLSELRVFDVGCGTGALLAKLCEWGATPSNLCGCDIQENRIASASRLLPTEVNLTVGSISKVRDSQFDLVSAFTVFSSLTSERDRSELASEMWRKVQPGGWLVVFDLRFNNPRNNKVLKVTEAELNQYWSGNSIYKQSLCLAPPIARATAPVSFRLSFLLSLAPFLRTHLFYAVRKPV